MEPTGIDQVIKLSLLLKFRIKVPLVLSGTFIFLSAGLMPHLCRSETLERNLAEDFFAEGNFDACVQECSRILTSEKDNETALLLKTLSETRTGRDCIETLKAITEASRYSEKTVNTARYELARAFWKTGKEKEALEQFKRLFISANPGAFFIRAGCSMAILTEENPALEPLIRDIETQMNTCSSLWSRKVIDECRISPRAARTAITGKPAQLLISFYRSQISPAIGQRCSLTPSCSEYAMQSLKKHGLLGVAMIGDRIIREPDVVAAKPYPVRIGDRWFYTDTVSEHDWWMTSQQERETNNR